MATALQATIWDRYPDVWAQLLANHLRWEFCEEECAVEEGLPVVVVVCIESQIL